MNINTQFQKYVQKYAFFYSILILVFFFVNQSCKYNLLSVTVKYTINDRYTTIQTSLINMTVVMLGCCKIS